jgi:hypothetical protein
MYYDRQGNPITMEEWGAALASGADRHVAETTVGDVWVSTVWLGLDHSWDDGPPLIFETMVFGGPCNEEMHRYSTEVQALAGHDQMVARVQQACVKEREL